VFVHLVETGLGQGNRLGEEPAPPTQGEADPPARSPVERRRRRLERGRQEHRGRAPEAPYGVGGGEPPAPRARIRDENVGERRPARRASRSRRACTSGGRRTRGTAGPRRPPRRASPRTPAASRSRRTRAPASP